MFSTTGAIIAYLEVFIIPNRRMSEVLYNMLYNKELYEILTALPNLNREFRHFFLV
jgi:hypothetical protein